MRRIRSAFVTLLAAAALSACVSVFPKSPPAQLYRFGADASPAAPSSGGVKTGEMILGPVDFTQAAAGDRILTVNGQETAYIAGSRWISPAQVLFDEALNRAFAASATAPRLVSFGRSAQAGAILRLEVTSFETRYEQGMEAAPTVAVTVHATLVSTRDRAVLGDRTFDVRQAASDNRVGAIAQAYDAAVRQVFDGLTGWTAASVPSAPR